MSSKHSRYVSKVHLHRSEDSSSEEVFFSPITDHSDSESIKN